MVDLALQFNRHSQTKLSICDLNFYIRALMGKKRDYMCLRSPCGVGRCLLAFGCKGEIYPCEEMSASGDFVCGNLDDRTSLTEMIDTSPVITSLRRRRVENLQSCRICPWRYFCGGGCLNKAYQYFGDIMREDPFCSFYQVIFEELMWKMDEDSSLATLSG